MTARLHGKSAIVTGAACGHGAAIAEAMADEGARVTVADLDVVAGEELAARIGARFMRCDVTRAEEVSALVQQTQAAHGRLDIVVNNAGAVHAHRAALDVSEEDFDSVWRVNVKSLFHMNRAAVPVMRWQGGGVFINITSVSTSRPTHGLTWHSASAGAVVAASRSLALELARDHIRVCVVCLGLGDTPGLDRTLSPAEAPDNRQRSTARVPIDRLPPTADVAAAVLYLASDESRSVTGVCLDVDGGRHL